MGHGAEQHIEHAEHAKHHAENPYDRQVSVSIAVVAAILAWVTMLGHRAHNDTLRFQNEGSHIFMESIRTHMDAGLRRIDENDEWSFYQAKKMRSVLYQAFIDLTETIEAKNGDKKLVEVVENISFDDEEKKVKDKEKPKSSQGEAKPAKEAKRGIKYWQSQVKKYEGGELDEMKAKAEKTHNEFLELVGESFRLMKESEGPNTEGHKAHTRADRFDIGELALQLGVVLCSMSILTKGRRFWYTGLVCAFVGFVIAISGLMGWFMDDEGHHTIAVGKHGAKAHVSKEQGSSEHGAKEPNAKEHGH